MAAVLAVAAVAIADGIRGRERTAEAPEEEADTTAAETADSPGEPSPALVTRLRDEGVAGRLVLVAPDCSVRTLVLPDLAVAEAPGADAVACAAPSPRRAARCGAEEGPDCVPRLRPGGGVVVVRDGGLWVRAADCPAAMGRCWEELLSTAELRRIGAPEPQVVDHVWLTPSRAGVLLAWPGGGYALGVYESRELIAVHRWGGGGPGRLEPAAGGALFTARPGRVFRSEGTPVTLAPRFRNARAVAWSPDGGWTALAMVGATVLVPTQALVGGVEAQRAIRLPFPADDLAWLGP